MDDEAHTSAMETSIRAVWQSYTRSFLEDREPHGGGGQALLSIFVDTVGFIGLWILFLISACPVVIMDVPFDDQDDVHAAHQNLVLLAATALAEYMELNRVLKDTSSSQEGGGQPLCDPNERLERLLKLFRTKCTRKSKALKAKAK